MIRDIYYDYKQKSEDNTNNYKYKKLTKNIDSIIDMFVNNFAIQNEYGAGEFMFSIDKDICYPIYRDHKEKNIIHFKFGTNIFGKQPRYKIFITTKYNNQTYIIDTYYHDIINKFYNYMKCVPVLVTDIDMNKLNFLIESFIFLLNNTKLNKWNKIRLDKYINKIKKYSKEGN